MQDILALIEVGSEVVYVFCDIDLCSLGLCALCHHLVKLVKRDGLTEVVKMLLTVQEVVEAYIFDFSCVKVLL